jgi:hypothetical protein
MMAYKIKQKKFTKNEYGFYMKGYSDALVGNKKAYSQKDIGRTDIGHE